MSENEVAWRFPVSLFHFRRHMGSRALTRACEGGRGKLFFSFYASLAALHSCSRPVKDMLVLSGRHTIVDNC